MDIVLGARRHDPPCHGEDHRGDAAAYPPTSSPSAVDRALRVAATSGRSMILSMLDVQPSLRVLVIEDDAASRLAIAKALREARHTVFEAVDGVTGLAIAQSEPLDAVVLDLMLPRLDGMRLLETLRQTSGVPVIVVSARQAEDDSGRKAADPGTAFWAGAASGDGSNQLTSHSSVGRRLRKCH